MDEPTPNPPEESSQEPEDLDILPPEPKKESPYLDLTAVPCHEEKFKDALENSDLEEALNQLLSVYSSCLDLGNDEPVFEMVANLMKQLQLEAKYPSMVFQHDLRNIPDAMHYIFFIVLRRSVHYPDYALNRTFLTPPRKRQLAKTMNAEPRLFALGALDYYSLGFPDSADTFVDSFTEISVPPVYKMSCSGRHAVFWCHNGSFYGCGESSNMFISSKKKKIHEPAELDIKFRKDEKVTGFRVLENATLFETDRRWYLVGDLGISKPYLDAIYPGCEFESATSPKSSNLWICDTRPTTSIMKTLGNDPKDVLPLKFRSSNIMFKIRLHPTHWTALSPGYSKKRPIVYLLNGVEVKNLTVENVRGGVIWVVHEKTLYHGGINMMLVDNFDGNEENLDNYIIFVELKEYRHPTPLFCNAVTSHDDSVYIKCGDYPFVSFDHLADREDRMRGNVHLYMFEAVQNYMDGPYEEEFSDWTMDLLIKETETAIQDYASKQGVVLDRFGRIDEKHHYANYFGFLCYLTFNRLPHKPMKCFDTDIDSLFPTKNPRLRAKYRMRELFAEFERVNYPGTDFWKPEEFMKRQRSPEEDKRSDAKYRDAVIRYYLKRFLKYIKSMVEFRVTKPRVVIDPEIIRYLVNIIHYTEGLYRNKFDFAVSPRSLQVRDFLQYHDNRIPDSYFLFSVCDPGTLFENRITEEIITFADLDERMNVTVKFRLRHEDPRLKDSFFETQTCRLFIAAYNDTFLKFIDRDNILDLNTVYPNDRKLHRIIAMTHFLGHGYTDLEGIDFYEDTKLRKLGWKLVRAQKFLQDDEKRYRGYLAAVEDVQRFDTVINLSPTHPSAKRIATTDGDLFVHRQLLAVFSTLQPGKVPPPILTRELTVVAIRALLDRRAFETVTTEDRVSIVKWYKEASMHEAEHDLIRQIIIDCTSKDTVWIRKLFESHMVAVQRFIAEHRPGILLWYHIPLPRPYIRHIKVITDMWPKNEYNRMTRFPRSQKKNGVEQNVFHQMGSRELRDWYMTGEDRDDTSLAPYYDMDFPLAKPLKIFNPENEFPCGRGFLAHPHAPQGASALPEEKVDTEKSTDAEAEEAYEDEEMKLLKDLISHGGEAAEELIKVIRGMDNVGLNEQLNQAIESNKTQENPCDEAGPSA